MFIYFFLLVVDFFQEDDLSFPIRIIISFPRKKERSLYKHQKMIVDIVNQFQIYPVTAIENGLYFVVISVKILANKDIENN